MANKTSDNKRIARNTAFLYVRMLLSIIVSLYTSRVVLQTLGVEDYGIYGVVGGVVSMFSFLNASMSGATSRFLSYAIGKGDIKQLRVNFCSAMNIHIIIAVLVLVVAETLGLWFLYNKLVIPDDRMLAAQFVYQFSIISMFFNVTQVPYNAVIIAHEKMDVYAYVELLNVFLKLGIVYLLLIGSFDKLILYAGLSLGISVLVALVYRVYCLKHFVETKYSFIWDKKTIQPMLCFSGWDLYGNMSVVFFTQGLSMLLNIFFGPALNAANNVSTTVQGTVKAFAFNVIQAFRPQIIKKYAQEDIDAVNQYCIMATQYTLILFSIIAVPFLFKTECILHLWLGLIPEHTVFFLRIVLLGTIFNLANNIVNIPIHACGRMKLFSLVTGSCFMISIPLMYILLKLGGSADMSYLIVLLAYTACFCGSLIILKRNIPDINMTQLFIQGYFKYIVCITPGLLISVWLLYSIRNDFLSFISIFFINTIAICICTFLIIMSKEDRKKFFLLFNEKLLRRK